MLKKILLPVKLGCIPALILGFADSIYVIRENDYVGSHLYYTASRIIIGNVNQYILLTVGAACLMLALYRAGGSLSGYIRIAYRTAVVSAVLIAALISLGYRGLLLQAYQGVGEILAGIAAPARELGSKDFLLGLVSEGLWQLIAAVPLVIVGVVLLRKLSADRPKTVYVSKPKIRRSMPAPVGRAGCLGLSIFLLVTEAWFFTALLAYGAFGSLHVRNAITTRRNPNVVFIMVDTLRADHVGCYGYRRNTTPNIDRLAGESLRFEEATAQASWTTWSVGSFMTSLYPQSLNLGIVDHPGSLDVTLLTLPEMLKDYGYKTGAVIANPNAGRGLNFDQGYDYFEEQTDEVAGISSPHVLSSTLEWLAKAKNDRFFLFVLFMDSHNPYINHDEYDYYPEYRGEIPNNFSPDILAYQRNEYSREDMRRMVAIYDSEIAFTDRHVGELLAALKKHGIYDDTLIVFVSDHGEEFAEHGEFNHVRSLYNELLHVPLIVKLPGANQGKVVEGPFPLVNLFPSILGTLHIRSSSLPILGKDVGFRTVTRCENENIFSATRFGNRELRSIRQGRHKYIVNFNSRKEKLFDIERDPGETKNLADSVPALRNELRKTLLSHEKQVMDEARTSQKTPTNKLTEEEKRKLESLGYL